MTLLSVGKPNGISTADLKTLSRNPQLLVVYEVPLSPSCPSGINGILWERMMGKSSLLMVCWVEPQVSPQVM